MGTYHVWVESDKIARDLLVHRGKKYGGRHEIPAAVGVKDGSEVRACMGEGVCLDMEANARLVRPIDEHW